MATSGRKDVPFFSYASLLTLEDFPLIHDGRLTRPHGKSAGLVAVRHTERKITVLLMQLFVAFIKILSNEQNIDGQNRKFLLQACRGYLTYLLILRIYPTMEFPVEKFTSECSSFLDYGSHFLFIFLITVALFYR